MASSFSYGALATPRSRRLADVNDTNPIQNDGVDAENGNQLCNVVLSKSLSIYKASPLYKLNFKKTILKALARKIGLYIQKVDTWREGEVDTGTQDLINVNAVPILGNGDQPSGILVTVTTTSEYGENGEVDQKEIFWGLFCKPGSDNLINIRENFLDLPLVLVKGRLPLIQKILSFFTQQFDCTVEKFHLSPLELTWMGAMWSGYAANIPRKPLKLVYTTPEEITGIDTISMSIGAENAEDLWKCIHDEESGEFLLSEVETFTKSLEAHFETYFKLKLAFCTLKSVMVTSLYAESSGKIKIFSPKVSQRILSFILSVIQQEMNA